MFIQSLLTGISDALFPPSEDCLLVRSISAIEVTALLRPRFENELTVLLPFENRVVRALIHEAKFHGNGKAFKFLGTVLSRYLLGNEDYGTALLIPIPLSKQRLKTRGYNQVSEIIKCVIESTPSFGLDEKILERTRDTLPQTSLSRENRLINMHGAFRVVNPIGIRGKHIILIDDVSTTGATMGAAKAALLPHKPARITCIALAH